MAIHSWAKISKTRQKWNFKKSWNWLKRLAIFEHQVHAMTGNGNWTNLAETCKKKFILTNCSVNRVVFTWRVVNVTWAPCRPPCAPTVSLCRGSTGCKLLGYGTWFKNHIKGTYFWWVLGTWNYCAIPQKLAACGATARAHSGRVGGRAGSSGNINDSPGEDYRLYSRICCHLTNFFKRARPLNFENLNNDVQVVVWNINNGA